MFKVKAWIFTPQVIICYLMMAAIFIAVLAAKPSNSHMELDTDGIVREYDDAPSYGTHTLTYKDMRDYQFTIVDNNDPHDKMKCIVYDGDRIVDVLVLDKTCHLYRMIIRDND